MSLNDYTVGVFEYAMIFRMIRDTREFVEGSAEERAWCAGIFDGEGNVVRNWAGTAKSVRLTLSVSQSGGKPGEPDMEGEPDLLLRFQKALPARWMIQFRGLRKGAVYPAWQISTSNADDVRRVYKLIEPWLGPVKKEQFRRSFEAYDLEFVGNRGKFNATIASRPTCWKCERAWTPENTGIHRNGKRYCRGCSRDRSKAWYYGKKQGS